MTDEITGMRAHTVTRFPGKGGRVRNREQKKREEKSKNEKERSKDLRVE
jgi:hypothetical protein